MATGKLLGTGACPHCDAEVEFRKTTKGHLYFNCRAPYDGGCATQSFSRSRQGDERMAKRIAQWVDTAERAALLGDDVPAKRRRPAKPAEAAAVPERPARKPDDVLNELFGGT